MRCAPASLDRNEPHAGTAPTVTSYLAVQFEGPWGVDVPEDSRVPLPVKQWLESQRGWRPLFIRRGLPQSTTRVFAAAGGELASVEVSDIRDVADLDLRRDLTTYDGSVYLVCTHGAHDTCCAELGRPLWQAMATLAPEETWQASDLGGDRFAGNVLVLPDALCYGRLSSADAERFVATVRAGRVDLRHLRGRCAYSPAAQAAEVFLRQHLRETRSDALGLVSCTETAAVFERGGRVFRVDLRPRRTYERLTCQATEPTGVWAFELDSVTDLS